jgi:AcrR family transcriptional regulator
MGCTWSEHPLRSRRERIVRAMVEVVCERENGFAGASVAAVCARAKVSGGAFYEAFDSRESCFLAALDEGHRCATALVTEAFERADSWHEGVRLAQAELLMFFDREPQLARVCVVESLAAGPWALERREQHVAALTQMIIGYSDPQAPQEPHPFAGEGVTASTLGVIQNHLLADRPEPLIALLGPLMGLAMAPYLDTEAVAEEVDYSERLATELQSGRGTGAIPDAAGDLQLPEVLRHPRAHRLRECILYVSEHPSSSNRQIAKGVGIARDTQISTTLARLARLGLVSKRGERPGGPNAWTLTARGVAVARTLGASDPDVARSVAGDARALPAGSKLDTNALQPSVTETEP